MWPVIAGVLMIFVGFAIRWKLSSRAFYRRNSAGIECFPGYARSVYTRTWECCARWLAVVLYLGGFALILISTLSH